MIAIIGVPVLVAAYLSAIALAFRRELRRLPQDVRRWRAGLPWRLAWKRHRLRKAPVQSDGAPLDQIDEARWAEALKGYGDQAGTEAVAEDELIAESLVSDEGAE